MKFNLFKGMGFFAIGGCMFFLGCASTMQHLGEQAEDLMPEPGTREYYEQKVKGSYALDENELVPIAEERRSRVPTLIRSGQSGVTLPTGSSFFIITCSLDGGLCFTGSEQQYGRAREAVH